MSSGCREFTTAELDLVAGGRYIPGVGWEVTGGSPRFDWGWLADAFSSVSSGFGNAVNVGAGVTGVAIVAAAAQGGVDIPNDAFAAGAAAATGIGYGLSAVFSYAAAGARALD